MKRPWSLLLLLVVCSGCTEPEGDVFNVTATLESTTCGSGVLDADDDWDFQIRLSLDDEELTWYDVDSAITTSGTLSDDEFSVADGNTYLVTEATNSSDGCSVRRHDKYTGDATLDDAGSIERLEGTLVYEYEEATGYDCDSLIGESDGIEDLPCEVEYSFVAKPD